MKSGLQLVNYIRTSAHPHIRTSTVVCDDSDGSHAQ